MLSPNSLIELAGFIALLLWGTHMVQTGVQRAFGANLRAILGSALRNRFRAFVAGLGVTALLQSSTATGMMTAGFTAGGLVELVPALAVMLGANVGTTLIVQLLSFNVAALAPALILVGVVMFRRDTTILVHDLGRLFIGFGLILLALHQLLLLMTDYEDAPSLRMLLGAVATSYWLDVLLGAFLAWAAHSSIAVVLLIMSLAAKDAVPPNAAFALVIGANLGTALNPLLETPASDDLAAKRLPVGNLLTRAIGGVVALALLEPLGNLMVRFEPDNARAVANFHTFFNLAIAAAFLPFLAQYAALLERWLPKREDPEDPARPRYLDPAAKETPIVALGAGSREALRLADVLTQMLQGAKEVMVTGNRRVMVETRRRDDVIDHLNTAIKTYLTSIDPDELNEADHRRLNEIITFVMNIEQAGDVIDRSLLPHLAKRMKRGLVFSKEDQADLIAVIERLCANVGMAASLFMTDDPRTAHLLANEKVAFRDAEARATIAHVETMRIGQLDKVQATALHLDLMRDMKLLNSHIVAAAAYPVLERSGSLLPSRITKLDL
ncbi:Na/Pi cotransporter family protein [Hyphomicrobium sp. MC1]|uniref:Na/Pi cotransporter family protein n=1 Tax=Hyphomicrobium sp. (strain MC1) TaxID=717785 RepID=UPI000213EB69|nr:Na/Pi cotransporter family protein [Hyphomicrobium sp. MC1]CCB66612.1 Na/Pi-cotransporter II-related protein [Hyphomicrobium sp. MC1]